MVYELKQRLFCFLKSICDHYDLFYVWNQHGMQHIGISIDRVRLYVNRQCSFKKDNMH